MASSSSSSGTAAVATSSSSSSEAFLAEQKQEYLSLCRRLNLDAENERLAWTLLEKFYRSGHGTDGSRVWPICALFLIFSKSIPTISSPSAYISLSQLLREANLRIMEFFEPLESFISLTFSDDSEGRQSCEQVARNVQLRFVTITVIFKKYQKTFDEFFIRDKLASSGRPGIASSGRKRHPPGSVDPTRFFHLGWLLFLVARGKILNQGQPDFLKLVYLLLCCMDLMLVHAPEAIRRVRLSELTTPSGLQPTMSHSSRQDTLARLCTKKDLHYAAVKEFQERVFLPFITTLVQTATLNAEPDAPAGGHQYGRDPAREFLLPNTMYLPGLMESCLDQNYRNLEREYSAQLVHTCDFDERLYLSNHPQLQTPLKSATSSNSEASTLSSPQKLLGSPTLATSPPRSLPSSPVNSTLRATSWLRKTLQVEGAELLVGAVERLQKSLSAAADQTVPLEEVRKQAEELVALCKFGGDSDTTRQEETLALYYRLLELVVHAEVKRLAATPAAKAVITVLMQNSKFHRSLLVVAAEIVICCYNFPNFATPLQFPATLQIFQVSAYDFGKVIESVVKSEPTMPRSVVKHLVRLEERVLEQLAWLESSPLYEVLQKPEDRQLLLQRLSESGTPQQPSSSPCQVFATPVKQAPREDGSSHSTSKTTSLDLFLRKVSHLITLRVRKLCEDLQLSLPYIIPEKMVQQIEYAMLYIRAPLPMHSLWSLFSGRLILFVLETLAVTQTDLMLNRHLDVIMMCTVYSLSKVSQPHLFQQQPVTFKLIIEKYHLQPQARVQVYKYVRVAENLDEDVIKFYNKIFLPQLEAFLLGFQPPAVPGSESPAHATRSTGVKRATRYQEQQKQLQQQQQQQAQQARRNSALQQISSPISFEKPRARNQSASSMKSPVKVANFSFSPMKGTATPLGLSRSSAAPGTGGRLIFQFGMSPHRQLEDINKSVNRDITARKKLNFDVDTSDSAAPGSPSSSQEQTPLPERRRGAKRKLELDGDVTPPLPSAKRARQSE